MSFPVDEQPTSIAKLGLPPIVSTLQGFQQDHPVILQLGWAKCDPIGRHLNEQKRMKTIVAHLNYTFLQQSLKTVVKQCVKKLDVGWVIYNTNQ